MRFAEPLAVLASFALRVAAHLLPARDLDGNPVAPFATWRAFKDQRPFTAADWILLFVLDWVLVLVLFWGGTLMLRRRPGLRLPMLAAACAWLALIYAVHQAPKTFWLLGGSS